MCVDVKGGERRTAMDENRKGDPDRERREVWPGKGYWEGSAASGLSKIREISLQGPLVQSTPRQMRQTPDP